MSPRRYDGPVTQATSTQSRSYLGRRLIGIAIDWVLCLMISSAFFALPDAQNLTSLERIFVGGNPMATIGIWAAQHFLLVATLGTTVGHRIVRLRVVRDDGVPFVGPLRALGRTVLLALVIPAVVWDDQGRGLHDRAVNTRILTAKGVTSRD